MTPSRTQDMALTALRSFLLAVLPSGTEVVRGQDNRVPMPTSGDFVVMTPTQRKQMAQTVHSYNPAAPSAGIERSSTLTFQLDIYGPTAADNAQVVTTLLRDAYGVSHMAGSGFAPLYAEDPMQMPLVTGEQQFIERWKVECLLHANVEITVPAEFADTLITTLTEVP